MLQNIQNIWDVYIQYDENYDNNIFVRAETEKAAIALAKRYVTSEGDEITATKAELISTNKFLLEPFEELVATVNDVRIFYEGKTEAVCYDAGT